MMMMMMMMMMNNRWYYTYPRSCKQYTSASPTTVTSIEPRVALRYYDSSELRTSAYIQKQSAISRGHRWDAPTPHGVVPPIQCPLELAKSHHTFPVHCHHNQYAGDCASYQVEVEGCPPLKQLDCQERFEMLVGLFIQAVYKPLLCTKGSDGESVLKRFGLCNHASSKSRTSA